MLINFLLYLLVLQFLFFILILLISYNNVLNQQVNFIIQIDVDRSADSIEDTYMQDEDPKDINSWEVVVSRSTYIWSNALVITKSLINNYFFFTDSLNYMLLNRKT
jgi:hypothetical protein